MATKQKKKRYDTSKLDVLNIPTIQGTKLPGAKQMQDKAKSTPKTPSRL